MLKKIIYLFIAVCITFISSVAVVFAYNYEADGLEAGSVIFSKSGVANVNVKNKSDSEKTVVFLLGEYIDGVLTEFDFVETSIEENNDIDIELSVNKDENSILKAYVWKDGLFGKALTPSASYPTSNKSIRYAQKNNELWSEFKNDVYEYSFEFDRVGYKKTEFKFYAEDNSTTIIEPLEYKSGKNNVVVTASDGSSVEYVLNIEYKAPKLKNLFCADERTNDSQVYVVPGIDLTADNYNNMYKIYSNDINGTSAWVDYPKYTAATSTLNNPGPVGSYVSLLGHKEGELYVIRTTKGPRNDAAYYAGGVGKYDGTDGKYFMTFDIEAPGNMYVYLREGDNDVSNANLLKEGYKKHEVASGVYYKHYNAGDTVKVPSMGWHSDWTDDKDGRKFMNSSFFMFGYDDLTLAPPESDVSDTRLASLKYIIDGKVYEVEGFDANVQGGEYEVTVPLGCTEVKVDAVKMDLFADIEINSESVIIENGMGKCVVSVVSYDKTKAEYIINFKEKEPEMDDATLQYITYRVSGEEETKISILENKDTYEIVLPPFTKPADIDIEAKMSAGDLAFYEVKKPGEFSDYEGNIIIKVTAGDCVTTKEYILKIVVEKHISEQENKIYDLTSFIEETAVKAENDSYQTDEEKISSSLTHMVIGENLTTSAYRNYNRNNKFAPSDDMIGASYIRTVRYYGNVVNVAASNDRMIKETIYDENGKAISEKTAGQFNSFPVGTDSENPKYGIRIFNLPEHEFFAGSDGWISFKVTSDCTVVVGDNSGFSPSYPNINPLYNEKSEWTLSDGSKNKIAPVSYYKTFKAGETVVIPNYGIAGVLADKRKVVYEYTDANGELKTLETDVAHTKISWEGVCIAIKWGADVSSDSSLAYIKIDGEDIDLTKIAENNTYVVDVPEGVQSVALLTKANHGKATIEAPQRIKSGETAEIKVIAEDGSCSIYYVYAQKPESSYEKLSVLKYKISDTIYDVESFDKNNLKKEYIIDVAETVKEITIIADSDDENVRINYSPSATVSLVPGETREIIIEAVSSGTKEIYSVKIFRKLYIDIDGTEDGGEV